MLISYWITYQYIYYILVVIVGAVESGDNFAFPLYLPRVGCKSPGYTVLGVIGRGATCELNLTKVLDNFFRIFFGKIMYFGAHPHIWVLTDG